MFNPLKSLGDLKAMRDQAMAIQKQLSQEIIDVYKNGYKIVISGDQKVQNITKDDQEVAPGLVEAVNEAIKKSQEIAAKKLSQMSGGLQGLLGGGQG
jgi:DNA-binding protein YbaB